MAGRVPLLDIAERRMHTWAPLAFKTPNLSFCLGTFVDNLFSTGADPHSAVAILQDAEVWLGQKWRLMYGADSKLVLSSRGNENALMNIDGWQAVTSMRYLGHQLSENSSIAPGWHETVKRIWAAYWSNASEGLRRSSLRAQRKFLNTSIRPVAGFRWSRWPWQRTYADRLDRLQRAVISCMRPIRPLPGEVPARYFRRRTRACSRVATECGKWMGS